MQNKCITILLLVLLVPMFTFGQSSKLTLQKKTIITEQNVTTTPVKLDPIVSNSGKFDPALGEQIGALTTNYDAFANSIPRQQIVVYNGVPYFANMVRPFDPLAPTVRHVVFTQRSSAGVYTSKSVIGAQSGWPDIDVQRTGTAAQQGTIGIVFHTPNKLAIWDATSSSFIVSSAIEPNVESSTDPSLQFIGDNVFLGTSNGRAGTYQMFKTADYGVTFTNFDSANHFPGIFFMVQGGTEIGMSKSPDETKLVYFGTATNAGSIGVTSSDSADCAFIIKSTNGGTSFTGLTIGKDGDTTAVVGYDAGYSPVFENFGQLDVSVGNNGVIHAVANGYGGTATESRFPVLYWNSNLNKWKAISLHSIDIIADSIMATKRPGNGIGQAWPTIAVSPDGNVIFVAWAAPEVRNGNVNVSETSGKFWTDVMYCYSTDGGNSFTTATTLPGANSDLISETWPNADQHLEVIAGNKFRAHMVWLKDIDAGSNINGEGVATLNPLMYQTFDIQGTDVNDGTVVSSFALDQNYPNPFNPSTKISFSLAERSNVSLKVYDMLGREVANLVSGEKESGSYSVNFNASDLASGLYVYTLKAGSNSISKKMMLMK